MHFSTSSLNSDSRILPPISSLGSNDRSSADVQSSDNSFASVLSQAKEKDDSHDSDSDESRDETAAEDDKKKKKAAAQNATATVDQLVPINPLPIPLSPSPSNDKTSATDDAAGTADAASGLKLTNTRGKSVAEMLARGDPTLTYQLVGGQAAAASTAAKAARAENAATNAKNSAEPADREDELKTPTETDAVVAKKTDSAATTAVAKAATDGTALAAIKPSSADASAPVNPAAGRSGVLSPAALSAALQNQEKSAGDPNQRGGGGGNSSDPSDKNIGLVAEVKQLKNSDPTVGTSAANWGKSMVHDATSTVSLTPAVAAVASADRSASVTTASTALPSTAVAASHAADMVRQVHEIADGLWSVDRQSVEVKFNFGERDLSVRVEYKDGQVQTTFNTDSADLRAALSHAWNSQSTKADQGTYRLADPVFTNSSSSGNSSDGGASKQSRSSEQPAFGSTSSRTAASPVATGSAASLSSRANLRPEVAGRLNVVV